MIPPLDPFAQSFDSIEIDPERAPSQAAIENAMSHLAPPDELLTTSAAAPDIATAGFHLLDDAGGRFLIDSDTGVISLKDNALLEHERGAVHGVRMSVVEQSGASYELDMQLRITGLVPQMVGGEELAALAGLTEDTTLVAPRVPLLVLPSDETEPASEPKPPPAAQPETAPIVWTRFAVAQGHLARAPRVQPRRGFITADLPATTEHASLKFEGLPRRFLAHLPWSL